MERILVISTMYPNKANPAFGIFVKNQVSELKKQGFQVDVAAVKDPRMGKFFVVKKYFTWIFKIICILLIKGRKYDIIHAHYVFPGGWMALLFKKVFQTRVIVTAHGGDLDKMPKKGPFFFRRTQQVLHQVDHIIAVGKKLKKDMMATFSVREDKITVLNMGVNRNIFTPMNQDEAKNVLDISSTSRMILYVGNIIEAKGVAELVGAYNDLKESYPSLKLHLIGPQKEPAYVKLLQDKIANVNGQDITIHPPMKQKEIAGWLAAADVFVIPSHMEGFGLVALEAMSCHTPVVGSDVGGLHYLLNNNAGVLVEPKDRKALSDGIESVINNDDFRNELIVNGEIKAQKYDQDRLIERLIELYQQE